ncbi:hypothetical protein A3A03_00390 [Candidatus Nomurabacteria bacterium RIFCSPLOWO2_01_FULL_40_18]|uniref:HAD family hydrolase n=1 Tax=Candidatus Nomurabacteria bacterium RIFCSPLOWO2_01_FULL_40_18 TaxID=1801773 RepID=A0A1F6XH84_9BACT|nr:MAG: hypothetical protein A3A03_00390 [Candidatus Nomurabacteria bacterium RIFCSPLOWO2_01_FULL_40_18]
MIKHIWFDFSDTLASITTRIPRRIYVLTDPNISEVLREINKIIPISIFSNIKLDNILPSLDVDPKLFAHILSAGTVGASKPALKGFYKMIELSALSPEEILYIGDILEKDIIPAKKVGLKTASVFENLPDADYSFKDFRDILKFVKEQR